MTTLTKFFPTAASLVEAPLTTLSEKILLVLAERIGPSDPVDSLRSFAIRTHGEYGNDRSVELPIAEGWDWLYAQGLICHHPQHDPQWMTITRKGKEAVQALPLAQWLDDRFLPDQFVHPLLRQQALPLFRQGLFDTAVFEAFKTLEITIRKSAGLGNDLIGTKLAARAFSPEDGPLSDSSQESGERQALMNLMCGAIGSYKNPQSHRLVNVDAREAREMIVIASHLLKIVQRNDQEGSKNLRSSA